MAYFGASLFLARRAIVAFFFGALLMLAALEIGLRTLGTGVTTAQEHRNDVRPEDSKALRIVTIGDSTTADFFSEPDSDRGVTSWPRQLEEKLKKHGIHARVYNLARATATSSSILDRLPDQLDYFKPDIVISMTGINDFNSYLAPNVSWWNKLKVVKFWRWLTVYLNQPIELPEKDFGNHEGIKELIAGLESSNPKAALEAVEEHAIKFQAGERAQFYVYLISSLGPTASKDTVLELGMRSLNTKFQGGPVLEGMADLLAEMRRDDECLKLAERFVDYGWIADDRLLLHFSTCARVSADKNSGIKEEWPQIFRKMNGGGVIEEPGEEVTKRNYEAMHRILSERNIVHIAMQYPTRPLQWLRKYFENAKLDDLLFVENRSNFEAALLKFPFDHIFIDRFAGNFGHTTTYGHKLIAESVLPAVLKAQSLGSKLAK